MNDCGCSEFEPCVDKPNCKRPPARNLRQDPGEVLKRNVQVEKAALDVKRGELEHRMLRPEFAALPKAEKDRLSRQSFFMEQYSWILFERLEADFK